MPVYLFFACFIFLFSFPYPFLSSLLCYYPLPFLFLFHFFLYFPFFFFSILLLTHFLFPFEFCNFLTLFPIFFFFFHSSTLHFFPFPSLSLPLVLKLPWLVQAKGTGDQDTRGTWPQLLFMSNNGFNKLFLSLSLSLFRCLCPHRSLLLLAIHYTVMNGEVPRI